MESKPLKPLRWVGSSREDLKAFPPEVRSDVGYALYAAQTGAMDPSAKPLRGFGGASVLEIIAPFAGDTWRAAYTVRFADAVYVLHAFQEKAKSGIATPKKESISFTDGWRRQNETTGRESNNMRIRKKSSKKTNVSESSGNVFADLGLPDAEQELMKARLTLEIYRIIRERRLTQTEAGKILGIPQPQVSALARNRSGIFSVGRLIEFLTALGQDVRITVTPARKQHGQASVVVA